MSAPRPYNLIAELSYRCPLRCAYCSNPLDFAAIGDALDAADWTRVFAEAAALGVLHVGLTGGEPGLRSDLAEIVRGASRAGLYTHLVTAGLPLDAAALKDLQQSGLESVQLSIQDSRPGESDAMAGAQSFERKRTFAAAVRDLGLPLTLNVVLQRRNMERVEEIIDLAVELGAERLELANVQLHGWALANRAALLPSRVQLAEAERAVARARRRHRRPEILFVLPDYHADRPKPCMGGWGRSMLVVAPDGRVLPCHGAAQLPGLEFWRVPAHSLADCWQRAPGMNAFRGESWMPEPCRSCPARARDFGGCRCQAFALTGDPAATDPACSLAPRHDLVRQAREQAEKTGAAPLRHRGSAKL